MGMPGLNKQDQRLYQDETYQYLMSNQQFMGALKSICKICSWFQCSQVNLQDFWLRSAVASYKSSILEHLSQNLSSKQCSKRLDFQCFQAVTTAQFMICTCSVIIQNLQYSYSGSYNNE
ncbi:Hypothetical_protein [Hexamita inflata]|uniref:Hypothetical_protein n=1 Tax=Hexamita inflata TaxID=28002 RepID=A0AA86UWG5_9EUKA|nr:Hypothetical protein HINF_LOCUS55036 [Hexamita inflata]